MFTSRVCPYPGPPRARVDAGAGGHHGEPQLQGGGSPPATGHLDQGGAQVSH